MASNKFAYTFVSSDKFTAIAGRVEKSMERVSAKASKLAKVSERSAKKFQDMGRNMRGIGGDLSVASAGIGLVGAAALTSFAKFEQLGVAFRVLIGDADLAKKTFADLTKFAAKTPFQLEDVAQAGKTLLGFKIPAERLTQDLRALGDIASVSGSSLSELALIYGKVKTAGKLTGETMLQFGERGVSITDELSEATGRSSTEITKMISAGQISFEDVRQLFQGLTTGQGRLAGLAEAQAKTLGGLFSTLQGSIAETLASIGGVIVESTDLKDVVSSFIGFIERAGVKIGEFAKAHPTITKMAVLFLALFAVLGPIIAVVGQIVLTIGGFLALIGPMVTGIGLIGGALGTVAAALLSPFFLIPLAIAAVVAAGWWLFSNWEEVWGGIKTFVTKNADTILTLLGPIGLLVKAGIFLANNWQAIWAGIIGVIDVAVERVAQFAALVTSPLEALGSFLGIGGEEELAVSSQSRTDVNVALSAPEGAVESVSTTTTGRPTGNVGVALSETI